VVSEALDVGLRRLRDRLAAHRLELAPRGLALAQREVGAGDFGAREVVFGLQGKDPLEREHRTLGFARVVRRDAEQVIELDVAGARAFLRQQKLVRLPGAALLQKRLRLLGQLVAERGATRSHGEQRGGPSSDRSSYRYSLPPAPAGGQSSTTANQSRFSLPSAMICTRSPTRKARSSIWMVWTVLSSMRNVTRYGPDVTAGSVPPAEAEVGTLTRLMDSMMPVRAAGATATAGCALAFGGGSYEVQPAIARAAMMEAG
jgi:hypothetical protein